MCEGEKNFLHQPDISAGAPENPVSEISTSDGIALVFNETDKEKPHYFEKIDFLSGIDKNKLEELQQADLVLMYRDNNRFKDMSGALSKLVDKYGKKVYCVAIPEGTKELSEKEYETLKTVLNTCKCMTDITVHDWIVRKDHIRPDNDVFVGYARELINQRRFFWITKNLEKKFKEKGIDCVYIFTSRTYSYTLGDEKFSGISYPSFDHGCMCQREDGSIYFSPCRRDFDEMDDEHNRLIEDHKRFWENLFPNLKIEFIHNDSVNGEKCDTYGSEQSVLIADRHTSGDTIGFKGKKIYFAGSTFEPDGGIEYFINAEEYQKTVTDELAEGIMETAFGSELIKTIKK